MEVRIERFATTKLVGKSTRMSFSKNKTTELWQSFMPKLAEIKQKVNTHLYSVEIYDDLSFFKKFNPANAFEKWAAVQVSSFESVPAGFNTLELPQGLYAVFIYKGNHNECQAAYQYIYSSWIPNSEYILENRPHFALMGEKYKNNSPDSEEELWIPVKKSDTIKI